MRGPRKAGPSARRATAAIAGLLSLGLAAPASAQYNKTEPPKTRFRLGPLRFQPALELRNAGRDTNTNLDPTDPLADTSIVLRGSVDGFVPAGRRVRLFGEGYLDWSWFRRYTTERSTDPGGSGRIEIDVGRFTLQAGGGGLQARQLYSIDIDERILRQEKWVNAGAEWRLTTRFRLSGGAEHRELRYDPSRRTAGGNLAAAASLDRNTLGAVLAARYKLTSMTTAVGTAEMIEDEYRVATPGLDTTRSYRYLAGVELGEKAFISGRFLAGMRDFPAASSGSVPSYRGPAYQGQLYLPLFNRLRLSGGFQRDVFVSSTPVATAGDRARNTYVLTALTGGADIDLPLDFIGRASVGYTEADYLVPTLVQGVSFPRVEHLYSAGGSLLRRFSDSLRVGGTVTWYRRVSTVPGNSYDRWVYGVSAELVP